MDMALCAECHFAAICSSTRLPTSKHRNIGVVLSFPLLLFDATYLASSSSEHRNIGGAL
jgi:hypothetical protein